MPSVRPSPREFARSLIDQAIRRVLSEAEGVKAKRSFTRLLWNIQARSDLLRPSRYAGRADREALQQLVLGVLALSEFRKGWIRPVEHWEPQGSGPISVFSSLAHHLIARYPVPPILLSAWFQGPGWPAYRAQRWFCHLGNGGSLRTAGLPLPLTKRMAHEFTQAPAHMPVEFALRWAQVRGLGGADDLARTVASTRLGRDFFQHEFWLSVIHLFLNTPRLDLAHVEPIVDYLNDQKFEARPVIIGEDTELQLDPPRPDLSIKGCSVASLLRRVAQWKAERRPTTPERKQFRWERSGIGEFEREEAEGRAWTIRELLDSDALAAEGKAMKHCVATYTDSCVRRQSTIWSLGVEDPDGRRRLLTIEVEPQSRKVVQASMKCNEEPDESCKALLNEWASREGLTVED